MAMVVDYVAQGNLRQYADKAFVDELLAWLRFNKKEALSSLDRLYSAVRATRKCRIGWGGCSSRARSRSSRPTRHGEAAQLGRRGGGRIGRRRQGRLGAHGPGLRTPGVADDRAGYQIGLPEPADRSGRAAFAIPKRVGAGRGRAELLVRYGYAAALPRSLRRPVEEVFL